MPQTDVKINPSKEEAIIKVMEHQDNIRVKDTKVSIAGTKPMEKMPMARFENPPPLMQMSVIPLGCTPLFYPKPIPQQSNMMRMPCVPPLMPPNLLGNPTGVQPYSEYNFYSREICYGFVTGPETCAKDGESSSEKHNKSLNKATKAGKSTEVSVTEKFCSIAKEHGLTVELVENEKLLESGEEESPQCPLNSTQSNFFTFESSEALKKQPHLNPLVDEYIPYPCVPQKHQENVDSVLDSSTNSDQRGLVTEGNLSTSKSVSGKDVVTDPSDFKIISGNQPLSVQQIKPPLRLLQLPNMPKVKKTRTSKDAIVQTDGADNPDDRICPTCQGKSSVKHSVAPIFKNLSLEQKTKYLALQASFLRKESSEVNIEEWTKVLKKKLKMLYKQFGTKDTDVSDWEDELMCQVLIGLLDDSPGLAAPDQNSVLLTRLREEVNVLKEITASLLEDRTLKVTEKSEPLLNDELHPVVTGAEETLQQSATKSALISSQGPAKVGEGMHLSNSSSGVSLSSAELSIGQTVLAVESSTALTGDKTATVSLSDKNETAEPMQEDKPPTLAVPDAKDDEDFNLPADKGQSQTYPPSLKTFFDSLSASHLTKSCSTKHINHPSSSSSQNNTAHILDKNVPEKMIVSSSVELKDSESRQRSGEVTSTVTCHNLGKTLDNRQLKSQSSASEKVAKLVSTVTKCETNSQTLEPLEKKTKMNTLRYSQDSIKSPCKDVQKPSGFEKGEDLRSRTQSEASVTSNKDTLSTSTVSKNSVAEVKVSSVQYEVDQQARDQAKSPGRLSKFLVPEAATDSKSFLQANPSSQQTQTFGEKVSQTLGTPLVPLSTPLVPLSTPLMPLSTTLMPLSTPLVPLSTPLVQSRNLMLNPPLSVTASSGSIGNVSNLGSSSAALFQTSVSSKNTLYQQLSTKSSVPKVGTRNNVSSSVKTEASERNPASVKGAFNFDKFLQEHRMLENSPLRPYSTTYRDASGCAAPLDVSPQSVTQHSVLNLQQTDRGYEQIALKNILELQTQQENEKLINLNKKYMDLMINLQSHPTYGSSIVNFSDPKLPSFLANTGGPLNFPGSSVPTISKTNTSEVSDENVNKNIVKSHEYENKRNVGISSFSPCPSTSSERSDENSLKKPCNKAPLDVRVRKVSSKGLKSVKDWVAGNIQGQVGSNADLSPKTHTADNRSHVADEEDSFHKSPTVYYKKHVSVSSHEEQKTAPLFNVQDINEFTRATTLPDYTKNVYTPQSLLEKYCYSSVAARFIALASTGSTMSLSWSNASNLSPERHSYAAIIKSTPLKTPATYSPEPTYSSCSTECPEKEDVWSMKSTYLSSNKEDTETGISLTDGVNCGNYDDEKSDRISNNVFRFHEKNPEAPQTGDCMINLMASNFNCKKSNQTLDWFDIDTNKSNQTLVNSKKSNQTLDWFDIDRKKSNQTLVNSKKSNQTLDWFDIDDISFSESVSSHPTNNNNYDRDILTHKSVFNDDRINQNYIDDVEDDSVARKSKMSGSEDVGWWEVNDDEEVKKKTEEVKPDTQKSSGDNNQDWMKVINARKQKVSMCDRINEFRQQEKYKNLTSRILEIHKHLTRKEAQDILETVFTMTDGMLGMRQPQILAEVQAAVTELYPEKTNAEKEINLNISGKYSTSKPSKNVTKTVKSRKRSPLSSENVSSVIDNIPSALDWFSNDLPHTTAGNKNKQVCFENASNFSQSVPNVVSSGDFLPQKYDSIKIDGPEFVVSDRADEAINLFTEHDLAKSNILVSSDDALKVTNNVDSSEECDSEVDSLVSAEDILSVTSNTCGTEDAETIYIKAKRVHQRPLKEDEEDHYFKKACSIQ